VNPTKSYTVPGVYTVTLKVTGAGGSNTRTRTGYVSVSAPVTSGGTSGTAVMPGLVAAFGFEEPSGTQVIDASGNANHGTISGALRVSGPYGRALRFDGSNDWVTIADRASLDLTSGMTVSAWVFPMLSMSGRKTIVMKEQSGGGAYAMFANSGASRPETAIFAGGAERSLSAGAKLPVNVWTHLAATYNGTTQALYVNGTLAGSRPQSGPIAASTGVLRLGGNAAAGQFFAGYIDEVRIYSRALTQAEIQADSRRGVVGLVVSASSTRTNPAPLNGQPLTGSAYISYTLIGPLANSNPVKQVNFWLDHPTPTAPTGTPYRMKGSAPFDLAGTASNGTALPLNTGSLAKGVHKVSAQVILRDGTAMPVVVGSFVVP